MFAQISQFLIETIFGLVVYIGLARFYMQAMRAPFRNPVGQFVMALTDWAVLPLRKIIPGFRGLDLASLAFAWFVQLAELVALYAIVAGGSIVSLGLPILLLSVVELMRASLQLLIFFVIVQVILSWVSPYHPLANVFDALTRPFYAFFRRIVPAIGSIDLSPLFVVLLAQILLIVLGNAPRALLAAL